MSSKEFRLPVTVLSLEAREPDGDALLEALRRGEPSAVGELYDAHHHAIRNFARRLVGEPAAAEDLVHDVFVTLPSAIKGFRGQSSLRTFLISIAVNHARHHVRKATRRRLAMERLAEEPLQPSGDPEQEAHRRRLALALSRALDRLPLEQRVVVVLCEVEGRGSVEVAQIVGSNENTIRTRLFHAKKKLRSWLEEEVRR